MVIVNNNTKLISIVYLIMLIPVVTLLFINYISIFGEDKQKQKQKQKQNTTIASTDYNFIAAGDWYCNEETKKTLNNILAQHPELIITTGDQVKESPSASCWIEMSKPIKDKMKIAIGNHDAVCKYIQTDC